MSKKYTIGVDEVGRGPLAGPVTVVASLLPKGASFKDAPLDLRDSKKYSPGQRELMFGYFEERSDLEHEKSSVFPKTIEKINIYKATVLAATRSVLKIFTKNNLNPRDCEIFLDGSLKLDIAGIKYKVVPGGDGKITAIKIASIIAKVKRDEAMVRYHKKFPEYGFDMHKGYGTEYHRKKLKEYGPCRIHRKTFNLSFS